MSDAYNLAWLILDHQMAGTAVTIWFIAMIIGVFIRGYRTML